MCDFKQAHIVCAQWDRVDVDTIRTFLRASEVAKDLIWFPLAHIKAARNQKRFPITGKDAEPVRGLKINPASVFADGNELTRQDPEFSLFATSEERMIHMNRSEKNKALDLPTAQRSRPVKRRTRLSRPGADTEQE